jgi:hypothetical protein
LLLLGACGREEGPQPYPEVHSREASERQVPPGLTTAERLGMRTNRQPSPHDDAGGDAQPWSWQAPPGWIELAPSPMRIVGFKTAPEAGAEFTFSSLPGQGGGLAENVNRWRKQMSLPPLSAAELQALPRKTLIGREAVEVDLEGTYVGMGQGPAQGGARLLGQVLELPMATLFLKLVGPSAVVEAERGNFDRFAASLKFGPSDPHSGAEPPPSQPAVGGMGEIDRPGLAWDVPEGWVEKPARPMRVVTLAPQGAAKSECYVSVLTGGAGGVEANVNRWREQMGQPALDAAGIAALEKIPMLGAEAVLVRIGGHYTGMGEANVADAALLGVICERAGSTLFVKMTGPAAEVEPQEASFLAFCRSLRD